MASKADQVRAWLNGSELNSREIAEVVGCHDGFVRAIKQRMLHPERERARNNARTDRTYLDRQRRYYHRRKSDPVFMERQRERSRRSRARRRAEAEARP